MGAVLGVFREEEREQKFFLVSLTWDLMTS